MGSTFTATSAIDLFANPSHTVAISYTIVTGPFEPHFRFGFNGGDLPHDGDPIDAIEDFAFANGEGLYFVTVFAGNAVNYSAGLHRSAAIDTTWRIRRGRQVLLDDDRNRRLELR
jgi:hypothetical protein